MLQEPFADHRFFRILVGVPPLGGCLASELIKTASRRDSNDHENMPTIGSLAGAVRLVIFAPFLLDHFVPLVTIYGGGCEKVAEQRFFLNFGASSAGRMVVDSLMTLEMDAELDVDPVNVDPVEEMRLRTWARKNYAPAEERDEGWHPIVLEEMDRKDQESDLMAVLA